MKSDKALYLASIEVFAEICSGLAGVWLLSIPSAETFASLTNRTVLFIMAVYVAVIFKRYLKQHEY